MGTVISVELTMKMIKIVNLFSATAPAPQITNICPSTSRKTSVQDINHPPSEIINIASSYFHTQRWATTIVAYKMEADLFLALLQPFNEI